MCSELIHETRELSAADLLFARLDRRRIAGRAATWITEVLGIFMEGPEAWVQIAAAGQSSGRSIVVRMSPKANIERVIAALRNWTDGAGDPQVPVVLDAR